ncbi:slightly ste11-like protein [Cytospora paraplurivora]|uniref:Slightly ste11-like protein n=1 Tax=Cytospora paraplurivora TaxID=2898453 RepID=A0AAN9UFX9_9PEZI
MPYLATADVVVKYPGLANPDISKIIGELWREEPEEVKNYWKRLAEEEKARHQRQYPQYKYQPRRGGKGGPAARPATAPGDDPGRCPKCHGRYIATPRTPATPFMSGVAPGQGPTSSTMQPFITNNPRVIEQVHHHRPPMGGPPLQQHGGDPRRLSYYPHQQEHLHPIEEDYVAMQPSMQKRRQPQHDDYEMVSPTEAKRRRYGEHGTSPDHPTALPAATHHPQQQQQQQQHQHQSSITSPINYAAQHQGARRTSSISSSAYAGTPSSSTFGPVPMPPLPRPRMPLGPGPGPGPSSLQHETRMAPPPRPPHFSSGGPSVPHPQQPPPLPSGPPPPRTSSTYDESLTLAPLKIPTSPTQASETSGGGRSVSGGAGAGLGIPNQHQHSQQQGRQRPDSQARGVEAMVMSIPYMNKLDVLRRISPALGPPAPGSPTVETRGPVLAIEGENAALMRQVGPVIEKALRDSGECEVKVWTDSSVARRASPSAVAGSAAGGGGGGGSKGGDGDDTEMGSDVAHPHNHTAAVSRSASLSSSSDAAARPSNSGTFNYLHTIIEWHTKSAEIIKHITTRPAHASSSSPEHALLPVALISDGFSLTLSDRFATTVAITDPYSPVDHWQWMATLWRGIVGPDLVVYVKGSTAEELAKSGGSMVEYRHPGVMVVKADVVKGVEEKTERRLAFEVMEWVRAGSFRDGYALGGAD